MNKTAIINLAKKAIISYAQEHYGWAAKYHPDERDKWDALMKAIEMLEALK